MTEAAKDGGESSAKAWTVSAEQSNYASLTVPSSTLIGPAWNMATALRSNRHLGLAHRCGYLSCGRLVELAPKEVARLVDVVGELDTQRLTSPSCSQLLRSMCPQRHQSDVPRYLHGSIVEGGGQAMAIASTLGGPA